ncbi:hypothetical protein SO802_034271 [Lithocarpus litseifolius]|uniref:Disease resistance R13L4/SHOC-2-like LRR domain-containing protein n=1 Tax=Lithocarpus litseifolius TaxID=425828 RepID=A0AAW2BHK8_9ROSI
MSPSNEIQTNPEESLTPVVQPTTLDTTTITTTTNNNSDTATHSLNKSSEEVDHHNNVDNSTERVALKQSTPETTPTLNSATINNGNDKEQPMECMCSGIWDLFCKKTMMEEVGPGSRGQDNSYARRGECCKCSGICNLFCKKPTTAADQGQSTRGRDNSYAKRVGKLKKNLDEIERYLVILENFSESDNGKALRTHLKTLKGIVDSETNKEPTDSNGTKTPVWIPKISKEIMKFKQQISSTDKLKEKLSLSADLHSSTGSKGGSGVQELGNVHQSASFSSSSFYNEIADLFKGLDKREKFFLSCFTVFPENAVVKRRIFVYWGLGEGMLYAPCTEEKNRGEASSDASVTEDKNNNTPEEIVDRILEEFQEKGLIEAFTKKRKRREHVKSYKMHPLVRSAVIQISKQLEAKDKFFDYDNKGNVLPQRDWASPFDLTKQKWEVVENVLLPHCGRMCMLKAEEHEQYLERKPSEPTKEMPEPTKISDADLEKVVTLFNVNEPFPDLELAWLTKLKDKNNVGQLNKEPRAVDWLSKMKNAKVVCLGSWPGSAKPHIEVESIEFLKGLTNSKDLRFLSLQGVSRIKELPDSIGKHSSLVILDLKECHNLEMLPEEITKLKELRYLDLSDCYLLARMPKGLGSLSELVVLKGFVISNQQRKNSGTLSDLKGLRKLRKLTINASSEIFPTPVDLCALHELGEEGVLRKLTIAWGAELADQEGNGAKREDQNGREGSCWKRLIPCTKQQKSKTRNDQQAEKLPKNLEKLDLQCFPMSRAEWLSPNSLPHLKKLYIRGGNLATLEDLDKINWSEVKTLRLKYLRDLKMTWIKMQESFPKLKYLEKVKCPGITLCPCDEHGVWMTDES